MLNRFGALAQAGDRVSVGDMVVTVGDPSSGVLVGLDTYERFVQRLSDELERARGFGRPVSVLMLRAEPPQQGHVSGWWQRVRAELRTVDTLAAYAPHALFVALPELSLEHAMQSARALVARRHGEPLLLCGVANFPLCGTSTEALLSAARVGCLAACPESTVESSHTSAALKHEASGPFMSSHSKPHVGNARMLEVYRLGRQAALGAVPVLILGEAGTGKELLARSIHDESPRASGPFKVQNCAEIAQPLMESVLFGHEKGALTGASRLTPGIFEGAHGGTLLLDEVGELSATAQAGLLRVIETNRLSRVGSISEVSVDVRVLATSHRNLPAMVAAGTFKADLFHSLNLATLEVPPLRERKDEIEPLCERFLMEACVAWQTTPTRFSNEAIAALNSYGWPGNVRELRNVIERAVLMATGNVLGLEDLPERVRNARPQLDVHMGAAPSYGSGEAQGSFNIRVRDYEIRMIKDTLAQTRGNQKRAATLLDMPLRTLVYKIRAYGLRVNSPECSPGATGRE